MEPTENRSPISPDAAPPQPEVALPQNHPEAAVSIPISAENAPNFVSSGGGQMPAAAPAAPLVEPPATPPPATTPAPGTSSLLNAPMPAVADDADLIEREWVDKAKAIVEHTKDDPHLQNKEINKMKADYIQKRYNRQIKINEG